MSHGINNSGMDQASSSSSSHSKVPHGIWKDPNPAKEAAFKAGGGGGRGGKGSTPVSTPTYSEVELELARKKDLIMKVNNYKNSDIFKKMGFFKDMKIPVLTEKDSLALVEGVYNDIKTLLHMEGKRIMVSDGFDALLRGGCGIAQNFGVGGLDGFTEFCLQQDVVETCFQPELEEIAIELSNSLVPNPYMRLGLKVFRVWKDFNELRKMESIKQSLANRKSGSSSSGKEEAE